MDFWQTTLTVLSSLLFCDSVYGVRDKNLYCGACRVLVDEISHAISKIDPKKTVQVGSFRVDPRGNQKTYKVPYARSEVHLTELFETLCENMNSYAESEDKETGRKHFIRTASRDGEALMLSNVKLGSDIVKKLKFACESLIEEHEEDIMKTFAKEDEDVESKLCIDTFDYCDAVDLTFPLATPGSGIHAEDVKPEEGRAEGQQETTEGDSEDTQSPSEAKEGPVDHESKEAGKEPEDGETDQILDAKDEL